MTPIPAHYKVRIAAKLLLTFALTPLAAHSQSLSASDDRPRFEVATIKAIDTTHGQAEVHPPKIDYNGRIVISGYALRGLVCIAFNVNYSQVSWGKTSTNDVQYVVEARPPQTAPPTVYDNSRSNSVVSDPRLRQMLQALLIDRFQLKFHRETKPGTVYLLQLSGKPLLLHPAKVDPDKQSLEEENGHSSARFTVGPDHIWRIYNTSMAHFAGFIQDFDVHHPVIDKTGLSGYYDAEWPQTLTDPSVYDGFASLPLFVKALGLKLTKSTGPVETLVIDHADLPSPN
ncbi:MAG TPA: TIGR03435 family protein [Acidobacteriaceae bacterium]|nr:TIGR03435 family protein [Acidobacteriaceae bacterium]